MRNAKQGLAELSRPGPLTVLRGDLGMSGIPGVIYAPEEGLGLPAVAFGHDWLQPPARYADLLRHLASWGFVTAAPSSHRGPLPSHAGFAADLRNALEVCIGVRLGEGRISVDSRRTAFAGHGTVILRTLPKASHTGFLDGRHWSDLLLAGDPNAKVRGLPRPHCAESGEPPR